MRRGLLTVGVLSLLLAGCAGADPSHDMDNCVRYFSQQSYASDDPSILTQACANILTKVGADEFHERFGDDSDQIKDLR